MPNNLQLENSWIDIIPPLAPEYSYTGLVIIFALSFLPVTGFLYYIYSRPRQRAKRQLRRLAKRLRIAGNNYKSISFELYACLCGAWSIPHLQKLRFENADCRDWQRFMDNITKFCFSQYSPGMEELEAIIKQARMWLKKKAVAD